MMRKIITGSTTTPEGEFLWRVCFKSSYYDSDPRMPGRVPVDGDIYVLAKNRDEALSKANLDIEKLRKQSDKGGEETIETTIVTLEELIAARIRPAGNRLGWISTGGCSKVELSSEEDKTRYRLAVCLVPIK